MATSNAVHLLDVFKASGLWSDDLIAAADGLAGSADDLAALADQLWPLGALTRYQYAKIRNGRVEDILLGPYLVLDKIGEGGMGKVFKAVEAEKQRFVALKTIRPQLMSNKTVLKRYEREAKAAMALNHPNVVTMFDAAEVNGRFVLAMEFVEGIDLSRMVKEYGRPPEYGLSDPQEVCEYIRQSALGLQAAHDLGFVHRDIKPSNMLVSGERSLSGTGGQALVKVLDMGLVRQMLESEETTRTELTRDGTVVGTPDYMAPEQAKNSSTVDHRADLYSLGCTLYFMLRGSPPFPDGSPLDKLIRHQLDAPPDLRPLRPDVPEAVHQVMERLLKKKPQERYNKASDVAAALAPFTPGGSAGHAATPIQPSYAAFSLEPDPPAAPTPLSSPEAPAAASVGPSDATPKRTKGVVLRAVSQPAATPTHTTPASGTSAPRLTPVTPGRPGLRVVAPGPATPVTDPPGPISGPLTAKIARAATPVSTPKPKASPASQIHRRPHRSRSKSQGVNPLFYAGGGLVVAGGFLLGFLVLKPSNKGNGGPVVEVAPPTQAAGPVPVYPNLPPAGQMFPAGTVAAAVVYPQPLWKATADRPSPPVGRGRLEELVKRVRFDTRQYDRVCVCFSAKAGNYVAVGEGPFLTPEWETETAARLGGKPTDTPGGKLFKLNGKADPNVAAVAPGHGYAVSNDLGLATALLKGFAPAPDKKVPVEVSRDLVKAFVPPTDVDFPVAAFAATGAWALPVPNSASLEREGVRFASAVVRWTDKFHVTLTLTGIEESDLKDFLNLELASQLCDRYPSLKPIVAGLAGAKPKVERSASGEVTLTLAAAFSWSEAAAALDLLIPAPSKKPT